MLFKSSGKCIDKLREFYNKTIIWPGMWKNEETVYLIRHHCNKSQTKNAAGLAAFF